MAMSFRPRSRPAGIGCGRMPSPRKPGGTKSRRASSWAPEEARVGEFVGVPGLAASRGAARSGQRVRDAPERASATETALARVLEIGRRRGRDARRRAGRRDKIFRRCWYHLFSGLAARRSAGGEAYRKQIPRCETGVGRSKGATRYQPDQYSSPWRGRRHLAEQTIVGVVKQKLPSYAHLGLASASSMAKIGFSVGPKWSLESDTVMIPRRALGCSGLAALRCSRGR